MVNFANCRIFRPCFPPKSAKKRRSITHSNWPFVFSKVLKKSNQNRSPYFSRKKKKHTFLSNIWLEKKQFFFLAITIVQTTNYFHKSRPLLSVYYLLLIMQENVIFCCQSFSFRQDFCQNPYHCCTAYTVWPTTIVSPLPFYFIILVVFSALASKEQKHNIFWPSVPKMWLRT